MQDMTKYPQKPAFFVAPIVFALAFFAASAALIGPLPAQSVSRPPISQVQMEKLLRVIEQRGENIRFNDRISGALGLGEGVLARQASAGEPGTGQIYFFATVPATGQYLVGIRSQFGADVFLINSDLRLLAAVAARGDVQKIPLPEAGKQLQDILSKFEAFLEMN
jgi:hypothetical protein